MPDPIVSAVDFARDRLAFRNDYLFPEPPVNDNGTGNPAELVRNLKWAVLDAKTKLPDSNTDSYRRMDDLYYRLHFDMGPYVFQQFNIPPVPANCIKRADNGTYTIGATILLRHVLDNIPALETIDEKNDAARYFRNRAADTADTCLNLYCKACGALTREGLLTF